MKQINLFLFFLVAVGLAMTGHAQPAPVVPSAVDRLEPAVAELIDNRLMVARQRPGEAAVHGDLGLVYEANLLWREARACYANAVQLDLQNLAWRYHLAIATHQAGDFDAATDIFRQLAVEFPDFPPAQQRLGHALLERGELDAARDAFNRLIRLMPQDAAGYVGLGDVLLRQHQSEEAAQVLEKAVGIAPGYRTGRYLLGTAYLRLGRREEARRELNRGVDAALVYIDSPLVAKVLGYAVNLTARLSQAAELMGTGRAGEAVDLLEETRRGHPRNVTLLNNLAIAYMRLNQLDRAEALLFEARKVDPEKFSTYLNLVSWAMRQRDLDRALEFATMAIYKAPQMAQPYYTRAQVLANKNRFEEALADLGESALRDHRNPGVHTFSGDLCIRLQRFDEARQHYRQAIEIDAEFLPAYIGLGNAGLALGDRESALQALEQARRIAPGHPLVQRFEQRLQNATIPPGGPR